MKELGISEMVLPPELRKGETEASPLLATAANKWWWSSLEPVCLTPEQVFENAWAGYPKYVLETTL